MHRANLRNQSRLRVHSLRQEYVLYAVGRYTPRWMNATLCTTVYESHREFLGFCGVIK